MSIYDILSIGLNGKGPDEMWKLTRLLSDSIEECMPADKLDSLKSKVYYSLYGGHFNREYADKTISKFYYTDTLDVKRYAPYWTEDEVRPIYEAVKSKIPGYTFFDFEVALNMVKSDNCNKLDRWFPDDTEEELLEKYVEETINYLNDEDNPHGTDKLWVYLNG